MQKSLKKLTIDVYTSTLSTPPQETVWHLMIPKKIKKLQKHSRKKSLYSVLYMMNPQSLPWKFTPPTMGWHGIMTPPWASWAYPTLIPPTRRNKHRGLGLRNVAKTSPRDEGQRPRLGEIYTDSPHRSPFQTIRKMWKKQPKNDEETKFSKGFFENNNW